MHVIEHDDEFMKKKFPSFAIVCEGFDKELSGCLAAEDRKTSSGDGGDEEDAVALHHPIVEGMGEFCL